MYVSFCVYVSGPKRLWLSFCIRRMYVLLELDGRVMNYNDLFGVLLMCGGIAFLTWVLYD